MPALYKLAHELEKLYDVIDEAGGEIDEQIEEALKNLEGSHEAKLESAAYFFKSLVSHASALREEERRLAERRKVVEARVENLRSYINAYRQGVTKAGIFQFKVRKSQAVEVYDLEDIPEEFRVYTYKPDKKAIGSELKAGMAIPGAELVERENLTVV